MFEKRLTRFEKARIVAARYMMLMRGAPPLVDVEGKDLKQVAEEELRTRKLPLTIMRIEHGEKGMEKIIVPLKEIEVIDEEDLGEIRCSTGSRRLFLAL